MLPASFLGAVHRHGLNQALLTRMLEDALSAYRRWRKLGFKVPVSVNLPTRLLDNPCCRMSFTIPSPLAACRPRT